MENGMENGKNNGENSGHYVVASQPPNGDRLQRRRSCQEYVNREFKPPRYKHFARGNKLSNSLLTKIRVGRSDLNQHKFTIGLVDSP